jgi:hypothetical protein
MTHLDPLASLCFEDARKRLEDSTLELSHRLTAAIKPLGEASWRYEKLHVKVCRPEEDGRRRRRGHGPRYKVDVRLTRPDVEVGWELFQRFAEEQGLPVKRVADYEADYDQYFYEARDESTGDQVRLLMDLPGEWNIPHVAIGVWVGPRFRRDTPPVDADASTTTADNTPAA